MFIVPSAEQAGADSKQRRQAVNSTSKGKKTSAVWRSHFIRRSTRSEHAELVAPELTGTVGQDGTILTANLEDGLEVVISELWDNPAQNPLQEDTLRLQYSIKGQDKFSNLVPDITLKGPITDVPGSFTIPGTVIKEIPDGKYDFRYTVSNFSGDEESVLVPFGIDLFPPYRLLNPAAFTMMSGDITDDTLTGDLELELPAYLDSEPGDKIAYAWLKTVPENPEDLDAIEIIDVPGDRKIRLTREQLEGFGNGDFHAVYVLIDLAGNVSKVSRYTTSHVALGPFPTNLAPPVVPLVPDDEVLDLLDAFNGVTVEIPEYDNRDLLDELWVHWGNTQTPELIIPVGPSPTFPLSLRVPWAVLKDEYSGPGAQPLVVSYELYRGSVPAAEKPETTISVDLSVIGPVNPDEPDPVNGNLDLVRVAGTDDVEDNELGSSDTGSAAKAIIRLYAEVEDDHELTLYWNKEALVPESMAGQTAGQDFSYPVPWAIIEKHKNGSIPVCYSIGRPTDINRQWSKETTVTVTAVVAHFDPPQFPTEVDEGGYKVIGCNQLQGPDHALPILIPPGPYLKDGTDFVIHWEVNESYLGDGDVILAVSREVPLKWDSSTDDAQGKTWLNSPYDQWLAPIYDHPFPGPTPDRTCLAKAWYTIEVDGKDVDSDVAEVYLMLFKPNGACDFHPVSP